ncbi:MarR family winged helix-turn-helix transcriptional regulator [Streptomyces sp. NPDC002659]|uniref:MarR family winged helix-turn-helix transcriptional regulator n=1 Tax=Streptomyces sp. NPDC002659 TaxID=3364656 RepID=UPI0036A2C229
MEESRDRVDAMMDAWRTRAPEFATAPLELVKRIGRLGALCTQATEAAISGSGVTYAEFDVLATLYRADPPHRLKPSQLAQQTMLSSGGMSNIRQRLINAGLVTAAPDPDDRRSLWLQLTDDGIALVRRLCEATAAAHAALFRDLPPSTAQTLTHALREALLALGDQVHTNASPWQQSPT